MTDEVKQTEKPAPAVGCAPLCSALASCPLLPCPECGSDGYVPHDAWDFVRCGNWNCRLHKIQNVLSREQWQMAPRDELVDYAKKLESAALELESLQQTPEEAQRVSGSGFSQFRKWKKETEEGRFAWSVAKGKQDVHQAVVVAWQGAWNERRKDAERARELERENTILRELLQKRAHMTDWMIECSLQKTPPSHPIGWMGDVNGPGCDPDVL